MRLFFILFILPVLLSAQSTVADVVLLIENKKFEEAETLTKRYLTEFPNNQEGLELLGDVFAYQEKWDDAVLQYKKLTSLNPQKANYHYKYGGALSMKAINANVFVATTYVSDIKNAFLEASQLDESHIDTRWALVKLYIELPFVLGGSKKQAMHYAQQLEVISKVDGYLAKGFVYNEIDDKINAEKFYKKALAVGGSKTCYKELSNFYLKHNEQEKALHILKQAYDKFKDVKFKEKIEEITR